MTSDRPIPHVLLVEDEHIVAAALSRGLRVDGAKVIGPAATVSNALALIEATPVIAALGILYGTLIGGLLALIEATPVIDGALVDINLRGIHAYDVVDALLARRVPIVLTTGYETSVVPSRYRDVPVLQKPFDPAEAMGALFPSESAT